MNFAAALLYPFVLLLPAAGAGEGESEPQPVAPPAAYVWPAVAPEALDAGDTVRVPLLERAEPEPAWQIRIEQRMQIRITPRAPAPMRPDMFFGVPDEDFRVRFLERKIGKCVPISGIAGVQPDRENRLLLYMRDKRLIGAEVERSCRARDFYSGFYLARTEDGQLCIDRDSLLSRSGMKCKLTRVRQLIEIGR